MTSSSNYTKYIFRDRSGWIVDSRGTTIPHGLLGIGHTAFLSPWQDYSIHLHRQSEEFYLLQHGGLELSIDGTLVDLQANELLMVLPEVPHAVLSGHGSIEHFGIRAPFGDDKAVVGEIPSQIPRLNSIDRELNAEWGCRIPLSAAENQNCWLFGWGAARHPSRHLILAYLNFPTLEMANAGIGTRLRMHYHKQSWEYYIAIKGRKVLQIEEELVNVDAGEILEVPPMVRHNIYRRQAPYEGFTIRVPIVGENDKVEDEL
jgi:mannose-6-phosphate isomerase-like protein (cupin superfamily)